MVLHYLYKNSLVLDVVNLFISGKIQKKKLVLKSSQKLILFIFGIKAKSFFDVI